MVSKWETLYHSVLNGTSSSNLSTQASGIRVKRGRKILRTRGGIKETWSSRHHRTGAYMNSKRLWQHTQGSRTHEDCSGWWRYIFYTHMISFVKHNIMFYRRFSLNIIFNSNLSQRTRESAVRLCGNDDVRAASPMAPPLYDCQTRSKQGPSQQTCCCARRNSPGGGHS